MTTGIGIDKATELSPRDFERMLLRTLTSLKKGDFKVRMPVEFTGSQGKIADTLNDILDLSQRTADEVEKISTVVGKEGKLNQRAQVPNAGGQWAVITESVNSLIGDLVQPTNEISRVIGAVARGDLSRTMATEFDGRPLKGEFLRTVKIVNSMVDQLSSFAAEVNGGAGRRRISNYDTCATCRAFGDPSPSSAATPRGAVRSTSSGGSGGLRMTRTLPVRRGHSIPENRPRAQTAPHPHR